MEDKESDASYAYHIFYAIENGTAEAVTTDVGYDSFSVNGYMVDFYGFSGSMPAGMTGLLRIDLDKEDTDSVGIHSAEDIKEIEFTLEVTDDQYNTILEETVKTDNFGSD